MKRTHKSSSPANHVSTVLECLPRDKIKHTILQLHRCPSHDALFSTHTPTEVTALNASSYVVGCWSLPSGLLHESSGRCVCRKGEGVVFMVWAEMGSSEGESGCDLAWMRGRVRQRRYFVVNRPCELRLSFGGKQRYKRRRRSQKLGDLNGVAWMRCVDGGSEVEAASPLSGSHLLLSPARCAVRWMVRKPCFRTVSA